MSQINNQIPDISYHLTFCFLSLQELILITQCSKKWRMLVYNSCFMNMFKCKDYQLVVEDENQMKLLSHSPFAKVVDNILIKDENLNTVRFLVNFKRLQTLCLSYNITWNSRTNKEFNCSFIFQSLASKLLNLTVFPDFSPMAHDLPPSIRYFEESLSLLTSLNSLTVRTFGDRRIFTNMSFLSQMIHLENFECDCIDDSYVSSEELVNNLICCTNLTRLDIWIPSNLHLLRELCTRLINSKLEHIVGLRLDSLADYQQYECAQLLNNLKNLKSIDCNTVSEESNIPILFGQWIQDLFIHHREFNEEDVTDIIKLSNLKSLDIRFCDFAPNMLSNLICCLSSKLECLVLHSNSQMNDKQLFQSLAKCCKLKTLVLKRFDFNFQELFILFSFLPQINSITLEGCKLYKLNINSKAEPMINRIWAFFYKMTNKFIIIS
jgi:hypothetical protein